MKLFDTLKEAWSAEHRDSARARSTFEWDFVNKEMVTSDDLNKMVVGTISDAVNNLPKPGK